MEAFKTNNDNINDKIIEFPVNKILEEYLKKFDIAHNSFNYNLLVSDSDIELLKKYYKDSYDHASILVTDDEFVGKTFDNLDKVYQIINKHNK